MSKNAGNWDGFEAALAADKKEQDARWLPRENCKTRDILQTHIVWQCVNLAGWQMPRKNEKQQAKHQLAVYFNPSTRIDTLDTLVARRPQHNLIIQICVFSWQVTGYPDLKIVFYLAHVAHSGSPDRHWRDSCIQSQSKIDKCVNCAFRFCLGMFKAREITRNLKKKWKMKRRRE